MLMRWCNALQCSLSQHGTFELWRRGTHTSKPGKRESEKEKNGNVFNDTLLVLYSRLIPVGDPHLTTKWYRNGVELEASNRISTMHDFGYVSLDIKYINQQDEGKAPIATNLGSFLNPIFLEQELMSAEQSTITDRP